MKMLKRTAALLLVFVTAVCLAGCQKKYEMTEADLEIQKNLVGFWGADDSTGYNTYDEETGYLKTITVVEFTEDYHHITYTVSLENDMVIYYDPIKYSIEDRVFKVIVEGVPMYAKVGFSEDGDTMVWQTDDKKDTFLRMSEERARELGIPQYRPEETSE